MNQLNNHCINFVRSKCFLRSTWISFILGDLDFGCTTDFTRSDFKTSRKEKENTRPGIWEFFDCGLQCNFRMMFLSCPWSTFPVGSGPICATSSDLVLAKLCSDTLEFRCSAKACHKSLQLASRFSFPIAFNSAFFARLYRYKVRLEF